MLEAALLLVLLGIGLYFLFRPAAHAARMEFAIPVQYEVGHIALSPDGAMLAYVAVDENSGEGVLFVQPVGSPDATRLKRNRRRQLSVLVAERMIMSASSPKAS